MAKRKRDTTTTIIELTLEVKRVKWEGNGLNTGKSEHGFTFNAEVLSYQDGDETLFYVAPFNHGPLHEFCINAIVPDDETYARLHVTTDRKKNPITGDVEYPEGWDEEDYPYDYEHHPAMSWRVCEENDYSVVSQEFKDWLKGVFHRLFIYPEYQEPDSPLLDMKSVPKHIHMELRIE